MTHTSAEKIIEKAHSSGTKDASSRILEALENPQKSLKIIKICGESGKSSTASMLSCVLSAAGYSVGCFTTPIIHNIQDSIKICENPIGNEAFICGVDKVWSAISLIKKNDIEFCASKNDIMLCSAISAFASQMCDVAILEIPQGVLCSSISAPLLNIITPTVDITVARELCSMLGRDGGEVVTAMQSRDVYKIIFDKCAELNKRLTMPLRNAFVFMSASIKRIEFTYHNRIYSVGNGAYYQIYNMLTVIEACEALTRIGFRGLNTEVCSALLSRGIPLRFEMISVMPNIIVDRADTSNRLRRFIESINIISPFIKQKPIVICESKKRKIAEEFSLVNRDATVNAIELLSAKKALRPILSSLTNNDTLLVVGTSAYCEQMSKLIKDILMG